VVFLGSDQTDYFFPSSFHIMTATFANFQAQQNAQNTIQLNVFKHCYTLIDALKQNYVDYSIRGHQRSSERGDNVDYHLSAIKDLKAGICPIDYTIESGKKYHKIIFIDGSGDHSVHCFVNRETGEVYKSASWKSPAKGVRFDLRLIKDREWLFQHADWSGGYLYR